jgi:TonB family protein
MQWLVVTWLSLIILAVPAGLCWSQGDEPGEENYDTPPKAVKMTKPHCPQYAFMKGLEGTVVIRFTIDEKGKPQNLKVVDSIAGLDKAALAVVREWRFTPAMKDGKPIATTATAPVTFRITHKEKR